jgi:hypothetical protein
LLVQWGFRDRNPKGRASGTSNGQLPDCHHTRAGPGKRYGVNRAQSGISGDRRRLTVLGCPKTILCRSA